jgi:aldehyde dehydrogenase (NAD+)
MSKTSTVVVEETQDLSASVSKKTASTVSEIFESLSYGPAPESSMPAEGWLDDHGRAFGHFIDGKWVKPEGRKVYETKNPATGLLLRSFASFCVKSMNISMI